MDKQLLEILACPECKGPLVHMARTDTEELVCKADRLAYPVKDGVPVMLVDEARVLNEDEAVD